MRTIFIILLVFVGVLLLVGGLVSLTNYLENYSFNEIISEQNFSVKNTEIKKEKKQIWIPFSGLVGQISDSKKMQQTGELLQNLNKTCIENHGRVTCRNAGSDIKGVYFDPLGEYANFICFSENVKITQNQINNCI